MKVLLAVFFLWLGVVVGLAVISQTSWVLADQATYMAKPEFQGDALVKVPQSMTPPALLTLAEARDYVKQHRSDPVALSYAVRTMVNLIPQDVSKGDAELLEEIRRTTGLGARLEPENMFWNLVDASLRPTPSVSDLQTSARYTDYEDHGLEFALRQIEQERSKRYVSGRLAASRLFSELYGHFGKFVTLVKRAPKAPDSRIAIVRIGRTIMDTSDVPVGMLVGGSIVRQVFPKKEQIAIASARELDRVTEQLHPDEPRLAELTLERALKSSKSMSAGLYGNTNELLSPWSAVMAGSMLAGTLLAAAVFALSLYFGRVENDSNSLAIRLATFFTLPLASALDPVSFLNEGALPVWAACSSFVVAIPLSYGAATKRIAIALGWLTFALSIASSLFVMLTAVPALLWLLQPFIKRKWHVLGYAWPTLAASLLTLGGLVIAVQGTWTGWIFALIGVIGLAACAGKPKRTPWLSVSLPALLCLGAYLVAVSHQVRADKAILQQISETNTRGETLRKMLFESE